MAKKIAFILLYGVIGIPLSLLGHAYQFLVNCISTGRWHQRQFFEARVAAGRDDRERLADEALKASIAAHLAKEDAESQAQNVPLDHIISDEEMDRLLRQTMEDPAVAANLASHETQDAGSPVTPEVAAILAIDALVRAQNGLSWYQDECPEFDSPADDELHEQIEFAISALRSANNVPVTTTITVNRGVGDEPIQHLTPAGDSPLMDFATPHKAALFTEQDVADMEKAVLAEPTFGTPPIGEVKVGRLPTVNQDGYPALGEWWVQLWHTVDGEEVVLARVYGNDPNEAREIAAQCWTDEETQEITFDERLAEAVAKRIAVWMRTGAQHANNEGYWRGRARAAEEKAEALAAQPGAVGGWKRVPVEPTPAMLVAMWDHRESMRGQSENRIARAGYAALLAAAPTEAKQDAVGADMFWAHDDGEEFGHDIEDIVQNYGPGDVVKIDQAKRLPTIQVRVLPPKDEDSDLLGYEVIDERKGEPSAQPVASDANSPTHMGEPVLQDDNLPLLCARLARRLNKHGEGDSAGAAGDKALADQANDYLLRKGHVASPLRNGTESDGPTTAFEFGETGL